jgi:hypothetical protein
VVIKTKSAAFGSGETNGCRFLSRRALNFLPAKSGIFFLSISIFGCGTIPQQALGGFSQLIHPSGLQGRQRENRDNQRKNRS